MAIPPPGSSRSPSEKSRRKTKRQETRNLKSPRDRSRRPGEVGKPQWTPELVEGIQRLREEFPFLGKGKLTVLLRKEGFTASSSTVGRILKSLKARGLLREGEKPRKVSVTGNRRGHQRPHAQRKPKDYEVESPGILPPSTLWTSVPSLERCISNLPPETLSCGGPTPPSIPGLRLISPGCSSRNSSGSAPFRCGPFR